MRFKSRLWEGGPQFITTALGTAGPDAMIKCHLPSQTSFAQKTVSELNGFVEDGGLRFHQLSWRAKSLLALPGHGFQTDASALLARRHSRVLKPKHVHKSSV